MPGKLDLSRLLETAGAHRAATGAAVGALVLLCGAALYLGLGWDDAADPAQQVVAPEREPPVPEPPLQPEEPEPEPVPLDASDEFVRGLLPTLTEHPRLATWLVTDDLVRRFVVAVDNVADGSNPARHVPFMRPGSRLRTRTDGAAWRLDPAGYGRYDELTRILASLDVEGAAEIFQELEPLMDEAYAELGYPDTPFAVAFRRAVVRVLETPEIPADPGVVPVASFFAYDDDRLEELPPVQKQLLLMGPDNVRAVQAAVREIASAIGIPDLPPPAPASR
ncbi:MAG: DUF3014 domain-containing protein [Acidobacteria bacterium]|nr:DUF3014 domain-containing protein [Acidobacteriota bacterium]